MQTSNHGARMIINAKLYQVSQVSTPHPRFIPMMYGNDTRVHLMFINPLTNHESET